MDVDRELKGAEAFTFGAALIGICGLTMRAAWTLEWGDPIAPIVTLIFVVMTISVLMYASGRCLVIGVRLMLPRFFHDAAIPHGIAIFLSFFVAIAPWNAEETARVEALKSVPFCSTIRCYVLQAVGRDPHTAAAPNDPAPREPQPQLGTIPYQEAPKAPDTAQ